MCVDIIVEHNHRTVPTWELRWVGNSQEHDDAAQNLNMKSQSVTGRRLDDNDRQMDS